MGNFLDGFFGKTRLKVGTAIQPVRTYLKLGAGLTLTDDPTNDQGILTSSGGGSGGTAAPVASVAALKALTTVGATPDVVDGQTRYVTGDPVAWKYDASSGAGFAGDDSTFARPADVSTPSNGRWYRATSAPVLATIAALRLAVAGAHATIQVQAHSSKGDGGGDTFDYDPSDTTSADDVGSVIVAGTRRYRRRNSGNATANQFGAKGDGRDIRDVVTHGTTTITSATANFKAADVGKDCLMVLAPKTAMAGTVQLTIGSYTCTGSGTSFNSLVIGNKVWIAGVCYVVINVGSDTVMSVSPGADHATATWFVPSVTVTGQAVYKAVTHVTTIASVTNGTTAVMSSGVAGSVTGARICVGTNDTAAIAAWLSYVATHGATGRLPFGIYLTDAIALTEAVHSGISIVGEGRAGQFGGYGSQIRLRSSAAQLIDIKGLRQRFANVTFDGSGLPTIATVNCEYLSSEVTFEHVNVMGAIDGESGLVNYPGTVEIDNHTWKSSRLMQDPTDGTRYATFCVKNYNANAFNISFTDWCYFANAQYLHRYQQGSCDVDKSQMFGFEFGAALRVETYAQMATWSNIYTEQTPATFAEWVFNAAGSTTSPFIFHHLQLNHQNNSINIIGTQPVYGSCIKTAGSINYTPVADQALAGTVSCSAASTALTGSGTAFNALGIGQMLRIGGELHRLSAHASNTAGTLQTSMGVAAVGASYALAHGYTPSTFYKTEFVTAGQGFTGTGATGSPRLLSHYGTTYFGSIQADSCIRPGWATNFTGWDSNVVVNGEAADDILIETLTADRAYTLNSYGWTVGRSKRFSRHAAADGYKATINGVAIANLPGFPSSVEYEWTGSIFAVVAGGDTVNAKNLTLGTLSCTGPSSFGTTNLPGLGCNFDYATAANPGASVLVYTGANSAGLLCNYDYNTGKNARAGGSGGFLVDQSTGGTAGDFVIYTAPTQAAPNTVTLTERFRAKRAGGFQVNGGPATYSGAGTPNGTQTGSPGDLYLNTSGGANTTLYVKESGASTNTGWVAK